jgi:hypothetical protein
MHSKELAQGIIDESKEFYGILMESKKAIWKSMVLILVNNMERITTEDIFLSVVREICVIAIPIQTNNSMFNSLINAVKGTAIGFILGLLDRYCVDKWFGVDWFARLRVAALKVAGRTSEEVITLLDDDEILKMYSAGE